MVKGKILFNRPFLSGIEETYIQETLQNGKFCGDGLFTKKTVETINSLTGCEKSLLTTSCTHALEMTALLLNIQIGDEVIMPSFTFVSTANAFVLRGAKIVFVDIEQATMNIDASLIERAITAKTKAIIVVHYASVSCNMDEVAAIAERYNIAVIEDAAQCIDAYYKDRHLGTFGSFGCLSFHETKNIHCGEGGALMINKPTFNDQSEIIREKGTNRAKFFLGLVDKYTWVDVGSSYLPSELNAAFLLAQLEQVNEVSRKRRGIWQRYYDSLKDLAGKELIRLPYVPDYAEHNGHIFYIKCSDKKTRDELLVYLSHRNISASFHYIPLHSSTAGARFGRFNGEDKYTTKESEALLRLPLYFGLQNEDIDYVVECVYLFFKETALS